MLQDFLLKHFPIPKHLKMPHFGIDLSDSAIKYVELVPKGGYRDILDVGIYGEVKLPLGVIEGGVVQKPDILAEALANLRKNQNLDLAHFSLPEEKVFVVSMEIFSKDETGLAENVDLHIEEHIPIKASETVFDFEVVGPTQSGYEVVVSAMAHEIVGGYLDAVEGSGIVPLSFEPESHSLARAVLPRGVSDTFMLVDVGRKFSSIVICENGIVRFSSSVNVGGDDFTKAIKDELKLNWEEAKKMKEEKGLNRMEGEKGVFYSILQVATVLRDEINERFGYWNKIKSRGASGRSIGQIVICGGNASIPGLVDYLSSGVDVSVISANPWVNILSFEDYIPRIHADDVLKYGTALGLAFKNVYGKDND